MTRNNTDLARVEKAIAELCAAGRGNVCFDADGVLWREDVGNAYLVSSIERHILRPKQEAEARKAWEAYCRGEMEDGVLAGLCATAMRGLREDFVAADARAFFLSQFTRHIIPQVGDWITRLQSAGGACWVISGSHRWIVTAGAEVLGIPPERVLAVTVISCNGVLTGKLAQPFPYGKGKAEAIRLRLPAAPEMVFGNTVQDISMLEMASRLAVAVEPDAELLQAAQQRNWPVLDLR